MPNFNTYVNFTVPGVIPLTIMDAQAVQAEIMSLVVDPRLTTILRLCQEGMATTATASTSGLAAEEPTVPSQPFPPTGSEPQPSTSTQADQPEHHHLIHLLLRFSQGRMHPIGYVSSWASTPGVSTGWWIEQWLGWAGILCL